MEDFDIDALDNIDFDGLEKSNDERQAIKDAQDKKEIEALREGADECLGGGCAI
jgi:hypothetical protein